MPSNALVVPKRQATDIPPHVVTNSTRDMQTLPPMTQPRLYSWHPQSLSSSAATPDTSSIWFDNFGSTCDLLSSSCHPASASVDAAATRSRPSRRLLNLTLRRTAVQMHRHHHHHHRPNLDDDDDVPKSASSRYGATIAFAGSRRFSRWSAGSPIQDDDMKITSSINEDNDTRHSNSSNSSTSEMPPVSSTSAEKHSKHVPHSPSYGRMAWTCFFPRNVDM